MCGNYHQLYININIYLIGHIYVCSNGQMDRVWNSYYYYYWTMYAVMFHIHIGIYIFFVIICVLIGERFRVSIEICSVDLQFSFFYVLWFMLSCNTFIIVILYKTVDGLLNKLNTTVDRYSFNNDSQFNCEPSLWRFKEWLLFERSVTIGYINK